MPLQVQSAVVSRRRVQSGSLGMAWSREKVMVLATLTCLVDLCWSSIHPTGPGRMNPEQVNTSSRPVTPDLLKIREALGMGLVGNIYLNVPIVSGVSRLAGM